MGATDDVDMIKRIAVTSAIVGGVLGITTLAGAVTAPSESGPSTTTAAAAAEATAQADPPPDGEKRQRPDKARRNHPGGRAIHSELLVRERDGEGFETVFIDKGKVTNLNGNSFTLVRPDGVSVSVTTDADTKFRGVKSASELKEDKPTVVVKRAGKVVSVGQRTGEREAGQPDSTNRESRR